MNRSRRPSLVLQTAGSSGEAPRLRKKLQKGAAKHRSYLGSRPESLCPNEPAVLGNKLDTVGVPSLLPPDLGDAKWSEYIRRTVYICSPQRLPPSPPRSEPPGTPADINKVPEFAHLAVTSRNHQSSSPLSPGSLYLDSPPATALSNMRRRAKTPVFAIGQLESGSSRWRASYDSPTKRPSSIELVAEQYRSLLSNRNSMFSDSHSEPPPTPIEDKEHRPGMPRRNSSDDLRAELQDEPFTPPPAPLRTTAIYGSPTSDDGTLVSFEEETVYFKPVSFSPEPRSPAGPMSSSFPNTPSLLAPDNLSLQICVDLLTRDLSAAIAGRASHGLRSRQTSESMALQVWVMIEAYERLREQIMDSRFRLDEVRSLGLMFDTWLRALYDIHSSLTGGDGRVSESEYGELEQAAGDVD